MASYVRQEVVTREVEFVVQSGQMIGEFLAAFGAARLERCQRAGLDPNTAALTDDWARVESRDGTVAIVVPVDDRRPMASEPGS